MKFLILIALLAIGQTAPPVPRKATDNPTNTSRNSNSPASPNTQATTPPAVSVETPKENEHSSSYLRAENAQKAVRISELPPVSLRTGWRENASLVFSLILVIVTAIQAYLLCFTLKFVRIQSVIMRRQTRHVARQAQSMRYQTTHLRNSVEEGRKAANATEIAAKAAMEGATATNKNVEMYISKERARLIVDLKKLSLAPFSGTWAYAVEFTVSIFGTTPAYILESRCAAYIAPLETAMNEEELADGVMFSPRSLPKVFPADSPPLEEFAIFHFATDGHTEDMFAGIKADELFVGVRGFIKYRDVFDRERDTRFRYVWKYSTIPPPPGDERWGSWVKCGKEEENRET
jgi:hypothetical protein